MAYELFLVRVDPSPPHKGLLRELRRAVLPLVPAGDPLCRVGAISGGRFRIKARSCAATVRADGADFRVDGPGPEVLRFIFAVASTGDLVITNAGGRAGTVLTRRAQRKHLPAAMRRPAPALCTSAKALGPLLGIPGTPGRMKAPGPARGGPYDWSHRHQGRRLGRGDPAPDLPGLRPTPEERHVYMGLKAGEGPLLAMERWATFARARLRRAKSAAPSGGGVGNSDWFLRDPGGRVFVPWGVTGYDSRPNSDHLVPANMEAWVTRLQAFARASGRATGTIAAGRALVLSDGRRHPLSACESRRTSDEDG